jgi:hypothetical protein
MMFAVEWLKQGVPVEKGTFTLADLSDALATTRARVDLVTARHPLAEPDGFRLLDSSGAVLITQIPYQAPVAGSEIARRYAQPTRHGGAMAESTGPSFSVIAKGEAWFWCSLSLADGGSADRPVSIRRGSRERRQGNAQSRGWGDLNAAIRHQ